MYLGHKMLHLKIKVYRKNYKIVYQQPFSILQVMYVKILKIMENPWII